ncbi:hypothetical protein K437DRAFT_258287 [Tilletiaria anomala UBC 951]|uniref:RSE1/DDB1/CPSF1 C-terminal domain-containing protein n=1 Tax=Tilletiaria anomala (strain ATCC 24038 / CBS 436.72 / UBC 951) TaxID=1037660 RepID=A0A066VSA8_TILAU|nr:uncharacterized protein K437DRAFT_258287 [Tilletiaria anomala UBC 951]KDN41440.1 hypothetical protein K437DRAFT_258287 [Tilletiaria anomala UBC 951]
MPIYALHDQLLPPSGAAFAVACQLIPKLDIPSGSSNGAASNKDALARWRVHRGHLLGHCVTARDDSLSIYEIRLRPDSSLQQKDSEHLGDIQPYLLRRHSLFGVVTGLDAVRTAASEADGADRILIAFKDAKLALLEFSLSLQDLTVLSIHTYERLPELSLYPSGLPLNFQPVLRTDPLNRCAGLSMPGDALAILPFAGTGEDELGFLGELWGEDELYGTKSGPSSRSDSGVNWEKERELPYNPSFVVRLSQLGGKSGAVGAAGVGSGIRNVRDFAFLPGFQKPTLAVLFEPRPTCTGLLNESKDTYSLFLLTLDLSSGLSSLASGATSSTSSPLTLISARDSLPYDSLYLVPCPESIGGTVIVTTTAIVHVDQSGQVTGLAVSRWWNRLSELQGVKVWGPAERGEDIDLQGSQLAFFPATFCGAGFSAQSEKAILALRDGRMFNLEFEIEGRSLAGMRLSTLGKSVQSSALAFLSPDPGNPPASSLFDAERKGWLWVASMVGDTEVLRIEAVFEATSVNGNASMNGSANGVHEQQQNPELQQEEGDEMDIDLYGPSPTNAQSTTTGSYVAGTVAPKVRTRMQLTPSTCIPALGPIADLTPTADAEDSVPLAQTVALTGARESGGMTRFEPRIKPRKRRRVETDGTIVSAVWSLNPESDMPRPAASPSSSKGGSMLLLASCEAEQISLLTSVNRDGIVARTAELNGISIFAAPLSHGNGWIEQLFLRVTPLRIEVRSFEGARLRAHLDLSTSQGESIRAASFVYPYLALTTWEGNIKLLSVSLQVQSDKDPVIREVSLPEGIACDATSGGYSSVHLFQDATRTLSMGLPAAGAHANARQMLSTMNDDKIDHGSESEDDKARVSTKTTPIDSVEASNIWMTLLTSDGEFHLICLADTTRTWVTASLPFVPWRLECFGNIAKQSTTSKSVEGGVSDVRLITMAQTPHLVVLLDNQQMHVYEFNPFQDRDAPSHMATGTFVKVFGKQLSSHGIAMFNAPKGDSFQFDGARIRPLQGFGAFLTGGSPGLLVRTNFGTVQFHECDGDMLQDVTSIGQTSVYAFVETGQLILAEIPDHCYDLPIPYSRTIIGRTYTKVAAHPSTQALIAASVVETPFLLFNPEDSSVVADPSTDPTPSNCYRGALELFPAGECQPTFGFPLQQNEIVCALELVSLASVSNARRSKEYIAVGTAISHGEDRPTKGAIYLFDIVETVPTIAEPTKVPHKLKLIDKEELRGPVTALTDMNGFLVHSIGQKLQVKALENDEWLISVAFLDLAFYVTSIHRIKNYLLLSDIQRSITFVAFQEEPYRLVQLGRDINNAPVLTANFLLHEEGIAFVTTDIQGRVRLLDYAPTILSTQSGQKLLLRTEYQTASETICSRVLPGKSNGIGISTGNEILQGASNGSIEGITSVDEETFKKLQLLQGYMTRNVRHFAGLNPRSLRAVVNETVPRPLAKGILDGSLLRIFMSLPRKRAEEMASIYAQGAAPEEVATVLRDQSMLWLRT